MRRFLIDTDTASDDAVALLMALREPAVKIEAVTVVAGNCPLATCIKNALICVKRAGTYQPPVFAGIDRPLMRPPFTSEFVHGEDGMGNMNLPEAQIQTEPDHAVDALIRYARQFQKELEIIALGPLTNLALALLREPRIAQWIKRLYIMGGAGLGPGNVSPVAEFNFFADAEAAHIVMKSDVPKTVIGWDVCMDDTFISREDIRRMESLGDLGSFSARCNASLIEFNQKHLGRDGFDLPDPTALAAAFYPEMVTERFDAYGFVEYKSEACYGQFLIDRQPPPETPVNVDIVRRLDARAFKESIFRLLDEHP